MAQQLFNAIILGSILLLFSLGLSLAWGTLDVLNLAHGSLFVFGGYLGYRLGTISGLSFVPVLLLVMVGSGIAAAIMEVVAFGPIRRRVANKRQAELSVLVASLGASIVLNQVISNATGNAIFAPSNRLFAVHLYHLWGVRITNLEILILVLAAACCGGLALWDRHSRQGKAARAVAFSPQTAQLMGINVRSLSLRIVFVSGCLAGLAGFLLSFQISGEDVTTGGTYLLSAFAILVLGGVGSVLGAVIAAYLIAIGETMVAAYGPGAYQNAIAFALIFVMLLVRPQGLIPRRQSVRE
jgi:branched-chain amino acid transport system permease protein